MTGSEIWSGWTIDGEPQTWEQMYLREVEARRAADQWAILVSDLDRCEHGRHQGDVCSSCGGPSRGNLILPPGSEIGHDLSAACYIVPQQESRYDAKAWKRQRAAD